MSLELEFVRNEDWEEQVLAVARRMGDERAVGDLHGCFLIHNKKTGERILQAIVTRDDLNLGMSGEPDVRWHISLVAQGRPPEWNEVAAVAHQLRPGVPMVMGIPPRSWWINVHPHALHIWETKDEHLVRSWREQARGDRPS